MSQAGSGPGAHHEQSLPSRPHTLSLNENFHRRELGDTHFGMKIKV